jgi:hypothetical protein
MAVPASTLSMRISWLVKEGKAASCLHHEKKGICFTKEIINTLKPFGLGEDDRIKFSDLDDYCGFKEGWLKPKGESMRIYSVSPAALAEFIQPTIKMSGDEEEEEEEEETKEKQKEFEFSGAQNNLDFKYS